MTDRNSTLDAALADLRAEGDYLDHVVSAPEVDLAWPTPASGWSIGHQIGHLTWTDRVTTLACVDPEEFRRHAQAVTDDFEAVVDGAAAAGRRWPGPSYWTPGARPGRE